VRMAGASPGGKYEQGNSLLQFCGGCIFVR
jgi:hypothetical protein